MTSWERYKWRKYNSGAGGWGEEEEEKEKNKEETFKKWKVLWCRFP
jgi:hypothetical protein